ncbi:hypothetical protein HK104_002197 [Borealophlyctis nickersoniae]|nr:hypothetical protein HK104_002197 [Borealophlyctis nickersoniae]
MASQPTLHILLQAKAKADFLAHCFANTEALEARVACYVPDAYHSSLNAPGRRALVANAIRSGGTFDEWTRKGVIFPTLDSIREASIPFICIARTPAAALELALEMLMKLSWLVDETGGGGSVIGNSNFLLIAMRIVYELIERRPMNAIFASEAPNPLFVTQPVQKALQELGLAPRTDSESSSRAATAPGPISHLRTASTPALETSRTPTTGSSGSGASTATTSDLETFLAHFISLPTHPSLASSSPSSSQTHLNKPPASPAIMSSNYLLSIPVPSQMASLSDPTFRRPVISPPYSRRASAERARGMEGKSKRARTMLEKLEAEMEDELVLAVKPKSRKGIAAAKRLAAQKAIVDALGDVSRGRSKSGMGREQLALPEGDPTEEQEQEDPLTPIALSNQDISSSPSRDPSTPPTVRMEAKIDHGPTPTALSPVPPLEMSSVLFSLQDAASQASPSLALDTRVEDAKRMLEERHRALLEGVERRENESDIGDTAIDRSERTAQYLRTRMTSSVPSLEQGRLRPVGLNVGDEVRDRDWDAAGGRRIGSRRSSQRGSRVMDPRLSIMSDIVADMLDEMRENQ